MYVDLCGTYAGVTKKFLNGTKVCSRVNHHRSYRVSEEVWSVKLRETGQLAQTAKYPSNHAVTYPFKVLIEEKRV